MQLTKERVVEVLESLASQTRDGAQRVRIGARMLATTGANADAIDGAVRDALFQAAVMEEAARLLKESAPVESP